MSDFGEILTYANKIRKNCLKISHFEETTANRFGNTNHWQHCHSSNIDMCCMFVNFVIFNAILELKVKIIKGDNVCCFFVQCKINIFFFLRLHLWLTNYIWKKSISISQQNQHLVTCRMITKWNYNKSLTPLGMSMVNFVSWLPSLNLAGRNDVLSKLHPVVATVINGWWHGNFPLTRSTCWQLSKTALGTRQASSQMTIPYSTQWQNW